MRYEDLENLLPMWGMNVAADYEFEEELLDSDITAVYPKKFVKPKNWKVIRVDVYQTLLNRTAVTFHLKCVEQPNNKVYYQRVRIYSPHIPVVADVYELLDAKVTAIKAIASVRNKEDDRPILIGYEMKLEKANGKKCNIACRIEDEKSDVITFDYNDDYVIFDTDDKKLSAVLTKATLSETEYLKRYFMDDYEKYLAGRALDEL